MENSNNVEVSNIDEEKIKLEDENKKLKGILQKLKILKDDKIDFSRYRFLKNISNNTYTPQEEERINNLLILSSSIDELTLVSKGSYFKYVFEINEEINILKASDLTNKNFLRRLEKVSKIIKNFEKEAKEYFESEFKNKI